MTAGKDGCMKNRNELDYMLKKVCEYMDQSGDDSPLVMLIHFMDEDKAKAKEAEEKAPLPETLDLSGLNGDGEEIFNALTDDLLAFASMADRMYISMLAAKSGLITIDHAVEEAARMIGDMNHTMEKWEEYADLTE